ncbi:pyrimidine 5'-nucleotidase [Roseinatronobacter bogoriensis]|uniref:Pyrimidine 5'-nucleotidase n=1 Tax=Roseinatronobacter bogoriensis subsp. barguzinensis TaxID=441209 RepID=A0A2K8K9A2_9RHOB|nr:MULTISPECIES: pyrimidine 5'-nucleotidase [Rhodobaca]ATX66032.1 pyrimidine 5'-nucleotidase [Rhodobaca barguzinensis]MBB4207969.1 putative hydrolase of the HAD superfamily [Rhodobaca bogoriensis DSM 18756]TDW38608.1 putative hydrolase of the HAD superfamily [Rhodobaca barguzinensis]TDY69353.1 putative hydrolase of the HAD superfamily [Rhodobaca bogoriensis DSM 18756]
MPAECFTDVRDWVFDLDNTLYPPQMRLFDQIEVKMVSYVMDALGVTQSEANHLRKTYWQHYGTTLAGLMHEHGIDPVPYMQQVHDIDFSVLSPDVELRDQIAALPGRRIIYTNGSADYALRVIEARGLNGLFDAIYGVEHAGYRPKPEQDAFAQVFALDGLDPALAAMFEDDPRNLAAPFELGMRTVHVAPERHDAPHIQHHTNDLTAFLSKLRP